MLTLEDFVIAVYCLVDDHLTGRLAARALRARGPLPRLTDAEVLTMALVGEVLSLETDAAIWRYFRRHWRAWFPALGARAHFTRRAADLWAVAQALQVAFARDLGAFADRLHVVDGVPLPVCRYGRKPHCRRFRAEASVSDCAAKKEWYYGFKGHLVISGAGVVTAFDATTAAVDERKAADPLLVGFAGLTLGDKNYASRPWAAEVAASRGITLATPHQRRHRAVWSAATEAQINRTRRIIETVLGQLVERFHLARTWARDAWHLTARVARKLLAHTVAVTLAVRYGLAPLQFEKLLAT